MRKNIIQHGNKSNDGRTFIDYDWFDCGIPANVICSEQVYIDTSYGFAAFHSVLPVAMTMGKASGCYDRASFLTGEKGMIEIGEFNILNGCVFICNKKIKVGNHCMFAWGSVVTDSWNMRHFPTTGQRREIIIASANDNCRIMPSDYAPKPVIIEDNVWVGFDAVVLSGVRLGRSCIIGSKSVVAENVPPYAVVAGNPAKIIRYLQPDDTSEIITNLLQEYLA
jgi:acetyltransferase-like isoleucine patch superfamily enzyme